MSSPNISRQQFMRQCGLSLAGAMLLPDLSMTANKPVFRTIPSSGEKIPVIGLGSWITFDVGDSEKEQAPLREVLKLFAESGGRVVDSSPMYGKSEAVIGKLAAGLKLTDKLWFCTKVWTNGEKSGRNQVDNSFRHFQKAPALLQVHNLLDYSTHIKTLRQLKEQGKIKYIGITHYVNSAHDEMARLIRTEKLDFIQIFLSIRNRVAENSLLSLAADHGTAVIINRPFETADLFRAIGNTPLPPFAPDWGIKTWAAFFLKYIISNPQVTCVIPATSKPAHLVENVAAGFEPLPDAAARKKMIDYFIQHI
jgi:diketogulonate reductase-like aldo/keto reductase